MKISWKIIPATPEHIPVIAANLREADRREVWASHRHTPEQALIASLERNTKGSGLAWTCFINDTPAFMWGVSRVGSLISFTGRPWLLGTPLFSQVQRAFLRQSRGYIAAMQRAFPRLENWVHAENEESIRWLRWCGFTVDPTPDLMNGENFYRFWKN